MRFTIKTKLGLAFGGILVLTATAGGLGIATLSSSNATMEEFSKRPFGQVQRVGDLQNGMFNTARLLTRATADYSNTSKTSSLKQFDDTKAEFDRVFQQYVAMVPADQREQRTGPVRDAWVNYLAQAAKAWDLTLQNNNAKAQDLAFAKSKPFIDNIVAAYKPLVTAAKSVPTLTAAADHLTDFRLHLESLRVQRYKAILATDDETTQQMLQAYAAELVQARADLAAAAQDLGASSQAQVAALEGAFNSFVDFDKEVLRLASLNTDSAAITMLTSGAVKTSRDALGDQLAKLKTYEGQVAAGFLSDARVAYASTRATLIVVVAGAVLVGLAMAFWISWSVSRGLAVSVRIAKSVASGDLSQEIDARRQDEVGDLQRAMKAMVNRLHAVVAKVTSVAGNVSSGSQELSASAEQLSQGSTEQASSTEEASASMEEMAANVKQNADNASQTETIARNSARDAEASGIAVGKAVEAMQTIAGKITVVQEIARQTDLLALNAAVEAARAGEHGRGFAVVASEVRKLAERSQAAAAEIGTLSSETVRTAQEAGAMLTRLVPDIRRTAELVEEITAACREQDVGAMQVNQAIQQLDKVTQQNASASEQVSGTAEELAAQAEQLQTAVAFFRLGQAAPPAEAPNPVAALQARVVDKAHAIQRPAGAKPRTQRRPAVVAGGGFALDMDGAEDQHDAAFRRSA